MYGLGVVEVPTHRQIARRDKNDLIFQTERGKFTALAKQVKALQEKGQPVLVGTVSIEKNEVLSGYFSRAGVKHEVLNAKNHEREGEIIAQAGRRGSVTIATNMAGRGVDIKLGGNPASQSEADEVRGVGGLFVIGTERHEARRIDNQLRGRSGRQGDPGETQFLVSLEDSLMRIFASDMIKRLMGSFKIPEDEPIENGLINRSLEAAQTKIEGFNFDARKHVLQYDDVLNHQRSIVYGRRRAILEGSDPAKVFLLQAIDALWMEHLENMDHLRGSVSLRAYGQRDPLVEYRTEGLRLFKDMEAHYAKMMHTFKENPPTAASLTTQEIKMDKFPKVGRNDPCPCGSKKKYKKCHGAV